MLSSLGEELKRLQSLKKVNPNIRDSEIQFLQQQIEESTHYINHAQLQLQGIRLIINN